MGAAGAEPSVGTRVAVGGNGVGLEGTGVAVGGAAVGLGGTGVMEGGAGEAAGCKSTEVDVAVGATGVPVAVGGPLTGVVDGTGPVNAVPVGDTAIGEELPGT